MRLKGGCDILNCASSAAPHLVGWWEGRGWLKQLELCTEQCNGAGRRKVKSAFMQSLSISTTRRHRDSFAPLHY